MSVTKHATFCTAQSERWLLPGERLVGIGTVFGAPSALCGVAASGTSPCFVVSGSLGVETGPGGSSRCIAARDFQEAAVLWNLCFKAGL